MPYGLPIRPLCLARSIPRLALVVGCLEQAIETVLEFTIKIRVVLNPHVYFFLLCLSEHNQSVMLFFSFLFSFCFRWCSCLQKVLLLPARFFSVFLLTPESLTPFDFSRSLPKWSTSSSFLRLTCSLSKELHWQVASMRPFDADPPAAQEHFLR